MKRSSSKKLNGQILLLQTQLMSKLATISQPQPQNKRIYDQLGFPLNYSDGKSYNSSENDNDALLNLISKSKNIREAHSKQIEKAKKMSSMKNIKKIEEGTFLTGLGMVKQTKFQQPTPTYNHRYEPSTNEEEEMSADAMLSEMIKKSKVDQLQELRRMIKKTGSNLQGCSRTLNKNKKFIMQVADKYTHQMPSLSLKALNNYKEFQLKDLEIQENESYNNNFQKTNTNQKKQKVSKKY